MYTWLRVAIVVLANFLTKEECSCRQSVRTPISRDLREFFTLEHEHTFWDHYVGLREYCLFYLEVTSHLPLDVSKHMKLNSGIYSK